MKFDSSKCETMQAEVRTGPFIVQIFSEWQIIVGMLHCTLGHCRGRQNGNCKGRITSEQIALSRAMSGEGFRRDSRWYVVLWVGEAIAWVTWPLERPDAMREVKLSIANLNSSVISLLRSPHHITALYSEKVEEWRKITFVSLEYQWYMQSNNPSLFRMDGKKSVVRIKDYEPAAWSIMCVVQTLYLLVKLSNAWNSSTTSSYPSWKRWWAVSSKHWQYSKRNVSDLMCVFVYPWFRSLMVTLFS